MAARTNKASTQAHMDQASAILRGVKSMHAKAIEAELGLSNAEGDRLYLAMKDDSRFCKKEPRKATYSLTPSGRRAANKAAKEVVPA